MRWRNVKQNKLPEIEETPTPTLALPYASIPDKIKAFITDAFLLSMPIFYIVVYLVFDGLKGLEGVESHKFSTWMYVLVPLGTLASTFYVKTGQTPGMKAYAIKVIDNDSKEKPGIILAVLRFIFFNMALFSIVGIMISFFRKDGRGLHDMLSGTSVIKVKDE